jgi:hypothetical protein
MKEPEFERLFTRLLITFENGSEICYAYNRESLMTLGMFKLEYDESYFIELGHILTINDEKYEVVNINFKLYPELYDLSGNYGINMYGITEPTDYNSQVGIFVKSVK